MTRTARAIRDVGARGVHGGTTAAAGREAPLYHDMIHTVRARRLQARTIGAGARGLAARVAAAGRVVLGALRRARAEREAIRQLRALDDRLLRDIGIERGRIPEVVRAMSRAGARPVTPHGAPSRETTVVAFPERGRRAVVQALDRAA